MQSQIEQFLQHRAQRGWVDSGGEGNCRRYATELLLKSFYIFLRLKCVWIQNMTPFQCASSCEE